LDQPATRVVEQVQQDATVHLAIITCMQDPAAPVAYQVDYVLMNPNGEHLGTGYMPLPTMYMAYLLGWLALGTLQAANGLCHRMIISPLHKLMFMVPFLKLAHVALGVLYWQQQSDTGTQAPVLLVLLIVGQVGAKTAMFALLLLMAKGWLITRAELTFDEQQALLAGMGTLVTLFAAYHLIAALRFIVMVATYMTVMALVASSIASSVRVLRHHVLTLQMHQVDVTAAPLLLKNQLFRVFQVNMFMYVTAKVIFRMMMVFFPNMPWLAYFLDELTETALWAMVCYNFRLRLPNAFILSQFSDPFSAYMGGYDPDFVISLTSADAAPLAVERDANEAGVVGDARRYRRAVVVEHPSSDGDSSAPKYCIGFVEEPDAQDEDEEARKEMARSGVHQGLGGAALVVADMDADSDGVWEMSGQDVAPTPRARRPPAATSQQWMHHHHHDHRTDVARSASEPADHLVIHNQMGEIEVIQEEPEDYFNHFVHAHSLPGQPVWMDMEDARSLHGNSEAGPSNRHEHWPLPPGLNDDANRQSSPGGPSTQANYVHMFRNHAITPTDFTLISDSTSSSPPSTTLQAGRDTQVRSSLVRTLLSASWRLISRRTHTVHEMENDASEPSTVTEDPISLSSTVDEVVALSPTWRQRQE